MGLSGNSISNSKVNEQQRGTDTIPEDESYKECLRKSYDFHNVAN